MPLRQRALAHVAAPLETLFLTTEDQVTRDKIHTLIATGEIYVDLSSATLAEPAKVAVWLEKPAKADLGLVMEPKGSFAQERDWTGTAQPGRLSTPD